MKNLPYNDPRFRENRATGLADSSAEAYPGLAWNARKVAVKCLTAQGQYEDAIRGYEQLIAETEDEIDSLFLEIDKALVELSLTGDFTEAAEQKEAKITSLQDRIEHLYKDRASGTIEVNAPVEFGITDVYPNPFNSTLSIHFTLSESSPVRLVAYDMNGRFVGELLNGVIQCGEHLSIWNVPNRSTGTYILSLETNNRVSTRQVLLLK